MTAEPEIVSLLSKHKTHGAVIDTNLFLLLIVGTYDPASIGRRRTEKYTTSDFKLIAAMVERLDQIVVTPNIMTEVDNLSRSLPDKARLTNAVRRVWQKVLEIYKPSDDAISSTTYEAVGLTDSHTITLASEGFLIVTDDFALYQRVVGLNRDAININHIRTLE